MLLRTHCIRLARWKTSRTPAILVLRPSSYISRPLAGLGHALPGDGGSLPFVPVEDVKRILKQSLAYAPAHSKPRTALRVLCFACATTGFAHY